MTAEVDYKNVSHVKISILHLTIRPLSLLFIELMAHIKSFNTLSFQLKIFSFLLKVSFMPFVAIFEKLGKLLFFSHVLCSKMLQFLGTSPFCT